MKSINQQSPDNFESDYFSSDAYSDYKGVVSKYVPKLARKITSLIEDLHKPSVLDAGSAHGYLIAHLQDKYGIKVSGMDISKYAITKAEPSVRSKIKLGSILDSKNFKENSFDLVFCQDVCEYLERTLVDKAVTNLVTWSKKYILFSDIYKRSYQASQKTNPDPHRITVLSQKEYIGIFKKAGAEFKSKFNADTGAEILIFEKQK